MRWSLRICRGIDNRISRYSRATTPINACRRLYGVSRLLGCRRDLEGIVAKWKQGTYLDGSTLRTSWLKIKNPNYTQIEGRGELFEKRRAVKAIA
jgi:hypothetical protein